VLRTPLAAALTLAVLAATPAIAGAEKRFAAPAGSGPEPCRATDPCSIRDAVGGVGADDGDEVLVGRGTYQLGVAELEVAKRINVHGPLNGRRPKLVSAADVGVRLQAEGSRLADLALVHSGGTGALVIFSGTAERVRVRTTAGVTACGGFRAVIRDSVCFNSGQGDGFVLGVGGAATAETKLRNVTAVATGTGARGIFLTANQGGDLSVDAANTIAIGDTQDVLVTTDSDPASKAGAMLRFSNFAVSATDGANTTVTPAGSPTNQTAMPVFSASPPDGFFHQAPGSPTIDQGSPVAGTGRYDIDGGPRVRGRLDIGADEYRSFDSIAPRTRIVRKPAKRTRRRSARFAFRSSDSGSRFVCRLDRRAARPCASPKRYRNLRSGRHVFRVWAIDRSGNRDLTPARYRWTITSR
jgi:hypothetical protein